jgi:hypothetical protein
VASYICSHLSQHALSPNSKLLAVEIAYYIHCRNEVDDNKVMYLSKADKVHIVLMGNPGLGKSTTNNSSYEQIHFESGVSYGGVTTCLQVVELADLVYADTPGLAGVELREQARYWLSFSLRAKICPRLTQLVFRTWQTGAGSRHPSCAAIFASILCKNCPTPSLLQLHLQSYYDPIYIIKSFLDSGCPFSFLSISEIPLMSCWTFLVSEHCVQNKASLTGPINNYCRIGVKARTYGVMRVLFETKMRPLNIVVRGCCDEGGPVTVRAGVILYSV